MQTQILEGNPGAELAVYAIWLPFLGGVREAIDGEVLGDPRVTHYWDGGRITSDWFAGHVFDSRYPAWDVYILYGPDARWGQSPDPALSAGGTVIGRIEELRDSIEPLLRTS